MKSKTINISSVFPASIDEIWDKLQRLETLKYIAAPYATFEAYDKNILTWQEGISTEYHLKLFGLFSFGKHTIKIVQFDKNAGLIYTNEKNNAIPVWNHKIILQQIESETTLYTDEVELNAGWKTLFVYCWGVLFYRHRQKKWLRLLDS